MIALVASLFVAWNYAPHGCLSRFPGEPPNPYTCSEVPHRAHHHSGATTDDRLGAFKHRIRDRIPEQEQCLSVGGSPLLPAKTLKEIGVGNDSTVELRLAPGVQVRKQSAKAEPLSKCWTWAAQTSSSLFHASALESASPTPSCPHTTQLPASQAERQSTRSPRSGETAEPHPANRVARTAGAERRPRGPQHATAAERRPREP